MVKQYKTFFPLEGTADLTQSCWWPSIWLGSELDSLGLNGNSRGCEYSQPEGQPDQRPLGVGRGRFEGPRDRSQVSNPRVKGKNQCQGQKAKWTWKSKFKLIRMSPTKHGFPGELSPPLLGIHTSLKEPAGVGCLERWKWLQRLRLGRWPRVSKSKPSFKHLNVDNYNGMKQSICCCGENLKAEFLSWCSRGSLVRNNARRHRCYGNYKGQ